MKRSFLTILFVITVIILSAQPINKVLIIGIDGCRPNALQFAETPNIDNLIANSIHSMDALNNDITISGPGWSSMLTGVWHTKHGVTDNAFGGSNYEEYPHFFNRVENFNPELHTASISQWGPINDFIVLEEADYKLNVPSGLDAQIATSNYLLDENPDALFVHFDDVDHAGHAYGFSIEIAEYIEAIESVDTHIGFVMSSLTQRPNYDNENWLILLSTDHGGLGFSHGGNSIEEENIFIIASNPLLTPFEIIKDSTVTTIPIPENCLNETIELDFDGQDDYVSISNNGLFDFGADQDFTIECRVRTTVAADVAIVGNKDWDSGVNKGFVFSFAFPSGPEWKVNIGDGINRADINTGGEIADGEWHTLSVSFDRDGMMTMYEDGVELAATDIAFIGDINTDFDLRFGADGLGAYAYNGAIAEVRIWNKVVEAATINDWFCNGLEVSHPDISDLLGYWKMNDGLGATTVEDFSPNANTGNINAASWTTPDTIQVLYDYAPTPRITDIALTALTHLCVPIEADWGLDGKSMVPECTTTPVDNLSKSNTLKLVPNPASQYLHVLISQQPTTPVTLQVIDLNGIVLIKQQTLEMNTQLDIERLPVGSYILSVITADEVLSSLFVK